MSRQSPLKLSGALYTIAGLTFGAVHLLDRQPVFLAFAGVFIALGSVFFALSFRKQP